MSPKPKTGVEAFLTVPNHESSGTRTSKSLASWSASSACCHPGLCWKLWVFTPRKHGRSWHGIWSLGPAGWTCPVYSRLPRWSPHLHQISWLRVLVCRPLASICTGAAFLPPSSPARGHREGLGVNQGGWRGSKTSHFNQQCFNHRGLQ